MLHVTTCAAKGLEITFKGVCSRFQSTGVDVLVTAAAAAVAAAEANDESVKCDDDEDRIKAQS